MADEKNTKTKSKSTLKDKKRMDISALAVVDNIIFSKTDVWAYYRLTNEVFDFLSSTRKLQVGLQISNAFNGLMSERQEPLECHMIMTSVPVDVDAWAHQVRTLSEGWDKAPGFDQYVEDQINYLKNEEYLRKITYLGVNLGKRGSLEMSGFNVFESGIKGAKEVLGKWWESALQLPSESVSASEEARFKDKEKNFHLTISNGHLQGSRATAKELLLLIKRQFYPSMPSPDLDVDHENRLGPGDLSLELHSAIANRYRWLEINQMLGHEDVTGYRATLSFTKFPKFQEFPQQGFPFLYFPAKLHLPFTCFSRFKLLPSKKMKADLEKKKKEQIDQLANLTAGQGEYDQALNGGAPADVTEALEDIQTMSELLAQGKAPWVEGSYRIVVETPSEELLRKYCSIVKQRYADLDINVSWSSGDQASLFLEQMPGDKMRMPAFNQISNLEMLATSGFNFSSDVGDPIFGNEGEVVT